MRKLSKINEGMFDHGIKRAYTDEVRTEDSVDIMSPDDFLAYIKDHYVFNNMSKYCNKFKYIDKKNGNIYNLIGIQIPVASILEHEMYMYLKILYGLDNNILLKVDAYYENMMNRNQNLKNEIEKICKVEHKKSTYVNEYILYPKNEKATNSFCLKVIDSFIKGIDNYPNISKK